MIADFDATPDTKGSTWTIKNVQDAFPLLAKRQTVNITADVRASGSRVVSVTRENDDMLTLVFGTWFTNTFNPALLSFDVSPVHTSTRYKTEAGAARAANRWLHPGK